MLTGEALTNTLVDELNDLGLPNMAATLDVTRRIIVPTYGRFTAD